MKYLNYSSFAISAAGFAFCMGLFLLNMWRLATTGYSDFLASGAIALIGCIVNLVLAVLAAHRIGRTE